MTAKRSRNIMLRLTAAEFAAVAAAVPAGEEPAVFARRTLLAAVTGERPTDLRRAVAFVVAALAPDIDFPQALVLFDEHAAQPEGV